MWQVGLVRYSSQYELVIWWKKKNRFFVILCPSSGHHGWNDAITHALPIPGVRHRNKGWFIVYMILVQVFVPKWKSRPSTATGMYSMTRPWTGCRPRKETEVNWYRYKINDPLATKKSVRLTQKLGSVMDLCVFIHIFIILFLRVSFMASIYP